MILSFLLGSAVCAVAPKDVAMLAELCRRNGILIYAPIRDEKNQKFMFRCRLARLPFLLRCASENALKIAVISKKGLPVILQRILCRPGLAAGTLLAVAIFILSSFFVWEVRVEGNEAIPSEELERALAENGLFVGCFLPHFDSTRTEIAVREGDARIAYLAVNLRGTVASVQVTEAKSPPPLPESAPANLVAEKNGTVTLPLVYRGECVVRAGDAVRQGQVLALGIMGSENNGTRFSRACGRVLARTEECIEIFVPFVYREDLPGDCCGYEISLLFFSKEKKVFKKGGNSDQQYDIINNNIFLRSFDGRKLPIGIGATQICSREERELVRGPQAAIALAEKELEARIGSDPARRVLEKQTEIVREADGVRLVCRVAFEENIARVAEFSVLEE